MRIIFCKSLFLAIIFLLSNIAIAEPLSGLTPFQIESVIAGEGGPNGNRYYSVRAFNNGGHDLIHDVPAAQRTGNKVLSAYFKDTGRRWVYLATRKSGVIHRSYFDLLNGTLGASSAEHNAAITQIGGGWYRVNIRYSAINVTSVHFGIAQGNSAPYFNAQASIDRVFFSSPHITDSTAGSHLNASTSQPSTSSSNVSQKGLWVWRADPVLDVQKRTELLTFMLNKELNTAYIDARIPVLYNHYMLSEFIRTFQSRGIAVELMFGKPEWALRDNHHEVLDLVDQAVEYTRRYPDAKPTAIHLDIEAHLVSQWQNQRAWVANQLVDLITLVKGRAADVALPLVVDMPVWWDSFNVSRSGVSRPLHQWVIDASDRVALMDYRDTEQRIVNDADAELRYATARNKKVVVGVETMCIPPELITFCEEGSTNMESILRSVDSQLPQNHSSYLGYAVHHYQAYKDLRR